MILSMPKLRKAYLAEWSSEGRGLLLSFWVCHGHGEKGPGCVDTELPEKSTAPRASSAPLHSGSPSLRVVAQPPWVGGVAGRRLD